MRRVANFLKHLLWQKEWIPLLIAMVIGFFAGIMLKDSQGAEFSFGGEKWAKPYRYSISDSCPGFAGHLYGLALDDMSPVPHERLENTHKEGFSIDGESIVYCSDDAPVVALREADGLIVETAQVTASDGAVIGKAQWAYHPDTREITQCDVWLNSDRLRSADKVLTLSTHEAGHCFGLRHVSEIDAVMYASVLWAKPWSVIDQAQMSLLYDGCHTIVHESGTQFVPSANVDRLVRGTEWAEWEGTKVSYLIDPGTVWIDDVYGVGESVC